MSHSEILYLAVAAVAVGGVGMVRSARRRVGSVSEEPFVVRSLVRVITDEDDLREALERASRFEEMVAHTVQHRADRYRAMVASGPDRPQTPSPPLDSQGHASAMATHPPRRARRRTSERPDEKTDAGARERVLH